MLRSCLLGILCNCRLLTVRSTVLSLSLCHYCRCNLMFRDFGLGMSFCCNHKPCSCFWSNPWLIRYRYPLRSHNTWSRSCFCRQPNSRLTPKLFKPCPARRRHSCILGLVVQQPLQNKDNYPVGLVFKLSGDAISKDLAVLLVDLPRDSNIP